MSYKYVAFNHACHIPTSYFGCVPSCTELAHDAAMFETRLNDSLNQLRA